MPLDANLSEPWVEIPVSWVFLGSGKIAGNDSVSRDTDFSGAGWDGPRDRAKKSI